MHAAFIFIALIGADEVSGATVDVLDKTTIEALMDLNGAWMLRSAQFDGRPLQVDKGVPGILTFYAKAGFMAFSNIFDGGYAAVACLGVDKVADAKQFAEEAAKLAPRYAKNWNYSQTLHQVAIVRGKLALRERRIEEAKLFLRDAVAPFKAKPDSARFIRLVMSLARGLLQRGELPAVLEYLEAVREVCKDEELPDQWLEEVRRGEMPDFGMLDADNYVNQWDRDKWHWE